MTALEILQSDQAGLLGMLVVPAVLTLLRPGEQALLLRWSHRLWPVLRPILGWLFLFLGVLGLILPVLQGILFLLIGAALIGPRHRVIRWPRVQYRLLLRRMARARRPLWRWLGRRGQQAMRTLITRVRQTREQRQRRVYGQRRFRVVLEAPPAVAGQLNPWRQRFDPALRYGLPPHIVLIAASRSSYRHELEHAIRALARGWRPFQVGLAPPVLDAADHRLICPLTQGADELLRLRTALAALVKPGIRLSQRALWPGLTLAKIVRRPALEEALDAISLAPQQWVAHSLAIYEERFGHVWYCVHTLPFFGTDTPTQC